MTLLGIPPLSPSGGTWTRQNRVPPLRIAALFLFLALAVLLGNMSNVSETMQSVSSSTPVAALQKALIDGHKLVASYAGYSSSNSKPQKRYIVLPATAANPGFCRTLFALLINDYGPPTIVSFLLVHTQIHSTPS